jgi:hypothetical protein
MTFKTIADQAARFFVGGLFIFSGLIKLNDPIGTEIKMEEYFGVFADDFGSFFELFVPVSLEIGMIMIILEIVRSGGTDLLSHEHNRGLAVDSDGVLHIPDVLLSLLQQGH